jgi:hypothetical protein
MVQKPPWLPGRLTLGDVRRHRHGRAPDLRAQSEPFRGREPSCKLVRLHGDIHGHAPGVEILERSDFSLHDGIFLTLKNESMFQFLHSCPASA